MKKAGYLCDYYDKKDKAWYTIPKFFYNKTILYNFQTRLNVKFGIKTETRILNTKTPKELK
jgi:hypothetical protein